MGKVLNSVVSPWQKCSSGECRRYKYNTVLPPTFRTLLSACLVVPLLFSCSYHIPLVGMDAYQSPDSWSASNSTIRQQSQSSNSTGRIPPRRQSRSRSTREHLGVLRTAKACGACRDRKTRCSGHQPTCDYCKRVGIECSYSQTGAVRLPSQTPES